MNTEFATDGSFKQNSVHLHFTGTVLRRFVHRHFRINDFVHRYFHIDIFVPFQPLLLDSSRLCLDSRRRRRRGVVGPQQLVEPVHHPWVDRLVHPGARLDLPGLDPPYVLHDLSPHASVDAAEAALGAQEVFGVGLDGEDEVADLVVRAALDALCLVQPDVQLEEAGVSGRDEDIFSQCYSDEMFDRKNARMTKQ